MAFTRRHEEIFTPNTYTQIKMDILDERSSPSKYNAILAFCSGKSDREIDIYGELSSGEIVARFALDLATRTGEMDIPNLRLRVKIEDDKFIARVPVQTSPDVCQFAANYLRVYRRILNYLVEEREPVKEHIEKMMLQKYPWRYN